MKRSKKAGFRRRTVLLQADCFMVPWNCRLTLDHVINHYSKKPVSKLTPAVAEILRTAVYQLLYLDSVPDSAAVNEAVGLTKKMKAASASGFVNAVLRNFLPG